MHIFCDSVTLGNLSASVDADLRHNRSDGHDHYQIDTLDFNLHFDTLDVSRHRNSANSYFQRLN